MNYSKAALYLTAALGCLASGTIGYWWRTERNEIAREAMDEVSRREAPILRALARSGVNVTAVDKVAEISAFIEEWRESLVEIRSKLLRDHEESIAELKVLLAETVPYDEFEEFVQSQMEDRQGKIHVIVRSEESELGILPFVLDPAKWPNYFPQGKFGYGVDALFAEKVEERWNAWVNARQ